MRSKVNVDVINVESPSLSVVSGYRFNVAVSGFSIPESARFPVTSREKLVYNAVCSLAKGKHAK